MTERPDEKIRRDLATLAGALEDLRGMCSPQGARDAQVDVNNARRRLAADVPSLLARVVAAEKKLAAVEALSNQFLARRDAIDPQDHRGTPGSRERMAWEDAARFVRAALADEVTR